MRIDSHQHFWRLADRPGHWPPPDLALIHRDFSPPDLLPLLHESGIDGTIVVQSLPSDADTLFMLALASEHHFIRGVVGWTDLLAHDAPARISKLAVHSKLKGLRPMLQDLDDDDWIANVAVKPAAEAMARHQLVFDALVLPRHLGALATFVERHPALTVVIDHAAKPDIEHDGIEVWTTAMRRLASHPRVHCKLSGLLTQIGPGDELQRLLPYVRVLWQLFGPLRLIWGSDWPVLRLAAEYASWVDMSNALLAAVTPRATASERAAIFGINAIRVYGLDRPPASLGPIPC